MAEQWLSIVDYARATGISDMTIRRRIRTGRLRAELKDGKYFIPIDFDYSGDVRREKNMNHGAGNLSPVKNHPGPDRTISSHADRSIPVVRRASNMSENASYQVSGNRIGMPNTMSQGMSNSNQSHIVRYSQIPDAMARPLIDAGMASVEARALIEFCDRALDQAKSAVQSIEAKYVAKIESMNAHLQSRDQEIKSLNQQIEDLQLLVQILERKKVG